MVSVSLADGARFICPFVPDMRVEVVNIVGFFLVNPQDFVHSTFKCGPAKGECGEFFAQVVAVADAKLFDGVGACAVGPMRANFFVFGGCTVLEDVLTHVDKDGVCFAHGDSFLVG